MRRTKPLHGMLAKLFAASLPFALVLLGLLMFSTGVRAKNLLEEREVANSRALIERNDQYLDLYLENLKTLLLMAGEVTAAAGRDNDAVEAILEAVADNDPATVGRMDLVREDRTVITSDHLVYDIAGHPTLSTVAELVDPQTEGGTPRALSRQCRANIGCRILQERRLSLERNLLERTPYAKRAVGAENGCRCHWGGLFPACLVRLRSSTETRRRAADTPFTSEVVTPRFLFLFYFFRGEYGDGFCSECLIVPLLLVQGPITVDPGIGFHTIPGRV